MCIRDFNQKLGKIIWNAIKRMDILKGNLSPASRSRECLIKIADIAFHLNFRFSKRQSRAAELTNELPMYPDPFAENIWQPFYATSRSIGG